MDTEVARAPVAIGDEALWGRVQAGDTSAFETFYRRHRRIATAVADRICAGEAEDVVQAAFLSAWKGRDGYRPTKGTPRSWILGIVRNRAIDSLRSKSRRREDVSRTGEVEPVAPDGVEDIAEARETKRELKRMMAGLPQRQRQVLELGYFRGLSQAEIARQLSLPLGTVKGRNRLALEKLSAAAL